MEQSIERGKTRITCNKGKLVSIIHQGTEYMHFAEKNPEELTDKQKRLLESGETWPNSEITMFPVIGPARGYAIRIGLAMHPMEQHGISRSLKWKSRESGCDMHQNPYLRFVQEHEGGRILNQRFSEENIRPEYLEWPFMYKLEKSFVLKKDCLETHFIVRNNSRRDMPYMLGWHPAFKGTEGSLQFNDKETTLEELAKATEKGGMAIEGLMSIRHTRKEGRGFELKNLKGFRHMILWSKGHESEMFCAEPVTHLPKKGRQDYFTLKQGQEPEFELLKPGEMKTYACSIRLF